MSTPVFAVTVRPLDESTAHQPETFSVYKLHCRATGESVSIIPDFGGILHQLVLRKDNQLLSLLKTPSSTKELLADKSYASAFLVPFASRIPDGTYTFGGKQYTLAINEAGTSNAIHGLVHRRPFTVINQQITGCSASLTLQYTDAGDAPGYPFPFVFTVTYELSRKPKAGSIFSATDTCALSIHYAVQNTGTQPCPVGFGWHPYFRLGNRPVDEWMLTLPARSPVLLDEDLQPGGYLPMEEAGTICLQNHQLDNVFALAADESDVAETILSDDVANRLIISQQMGPGKCSFLICYTPPKRDCIAIEPQTANVNAFNNGEGLTTLQPGHELTGTIRVGLT